MFSRKKKVLLVLILFTAFYYAFSALVSVLTEILIYIIVAPSATITLFDYYNYTAISWGANVFGVQSNANENRLFF